MVKALFNGTVVAETEDYEVVEGNIYFPSESIKREYFSGGSGGQKRSFSKHQNYCEKTQIYSPLTPPQTLQCVIK